MMKTVLIFGYSGFVGGYLSRELLDHGYIVVGSDIVDNTLEKNQNVKFTKADLLSYEVVKGIIQNSQPDYIVNLAAISSVGMSWSIPQKTININVNGTLNILEAVRELGLNPKILLVGSSEEYDIYDKKINENSDINANNPYGISKVTQEHFSELYRQEYGMNIVNTRTFNHTGFGQPEKFAIPNFVKQVADIHKSGKPGSIYVGNLSAKRDLGDVRDMVCAYRMLLENDTKSKVFNVGSGSCYMMGDILKYIVSLTNQHIDIIVDPDKLRPVDNPIIWCDNSRIQQEIGWKPQYTVKDAINDMFTCYIKNGKV